MSDTKELELIAFKEGDIQKWCEAKNAAGEVMPTDTSVLEDLFHLSRMRCKDILVAVRLSSRDILKSHGSSAGDEPITVREQLIAREARNRINVSVTDMLKEADEVILLFPSALVRDRVYMKLAVEIVGIIDKKRSDVNLRDMWTLDNKHIKFIVHNDVYDIPDRSVVYKVINDAI